MADAHPAAHNAIALTLRDDFQPQIATNINNIAGNAAEIASNFTEITDVYNLNGQIKATNPEIWSDNPVDMKSAAGVGAGVYVGMNTLAAGYSNRDVVNSFVDPGLGYVRLGAEVVIPVDYSPGGQILIMTARCTAILQGASSEGIYVKPCYQIDAGGFTETSSNYSGSARNYIDPGRFDADVHSLPAVVHVPAGADTVTVKPMATSVGATVTIEESAIAVTVIHL